MQAVKRMAAVSLDQLEKLSEFTATPTSQLKFVLDAWAQVSLSAAPATGAGLTASHACPCFTRLPILQPT